MSDTVEAQEDAAEPEDLIYHGPADKILIPGVGELIPGKKVRVAAYLVEALLKLHPGHISRVKKEGA